MSDSPVQQGCNAGGSGNAAKPTQADRQWWTATVADCLDPMYRYVKTRVPADAADDLVQEIFVSAAGNAARYDSNVGTVWMWLVGIAKRRIADYYRGLGGDPLLKTAVRKFSLDSTAVRESIASGEALPDEICESGEFRTIVRAALSSLEPGYQDCLNHRYYDGLSMTDVARKLDLSPSAANSLLYRARIRLREAVEQLIGTVPEFQED